MSFDQWRTAEVFYSTSFWLYLIAIAVLLLIGTFGLMYIRKKNQVAKLVVIVAGIGMMIFGLLLYTGYTRYSLYLEMMQQVNPLVRDREPIPIGQYTYFSETEMGYYSKLNDAQGIRELGIYEEETIIEPFTYLGRDIHVYYFEKDGKIFKTTKPVVFDGTTVETEMAGTQFKLEDPAFQNIGFINPPNKFFEQITVAETKREKVYDPDSDYGIYDIADVFRDWNF